MDTQDLTFTGNYLFEPNIYTSKYTEKWENMAQSVSIMGQCGRITFTRGKFTLHTGIVNPFTISSAIYGTLDPAPATFGGIYINNAIG